MSRGTYWQVVSARKSVQGGHGCSDVAMALRSSRIRGGLVQNTLGVCVGVSVIPQGPVS